MPTPPRATTTLQRFVKPVRLLAAACAAAAVLAAGCGSSTVPAATVDGTEISQRQVVDELEAIRANTDYLTAYETAIGSVLGSGEGSFDSAFVAEQLRFQILYTMVTNEVDRRRLDVSDDCRQAARGSLIDQFASFAPTGDGETLLEGFDNDYRGYLIDREAALLALQGNLVGFPCVAGQEALRAYFEAHQAELDQVCTRHILVATEAEALDITAQLAGGAEFAALAAERSTDTASGTQGGDLGCTSSDSFVPEFGAATETLPLNEPSAPVQTQFGFHIIEVLSRGIPSFEDARDQIGRQLANEANTAFQAFFSSAVDTSTVVVDPRYGEWDPATGTITRPAAPPDTVGG